MGNTKLDPRSLNAEERAIVDHEASRFHRDWTGEARYEAALSICEPIILARRAIFGEPASEGGKVEYKNCHYSCGAAIRFEDGLQAEYHDCKPAQPEPVVAEMPEAVKGFKLLALARDRYNVLIESGFVPSAREWRVAIEEFVADEGNWRTHAAQPAPAVAMTEERKVYTKVESLLAALRWDLDRFPGQAILHFADQIDAAEREVRAQAAEAGKVRLPKVRELFEHVQHYPMTVNGSEILRLAIKEADAAEGRK